MGSDRIAHRIIVGAALAAEVATARMSTHTLRKPFAARIYAATDGDLIKTQRTMSAHDTLIFASAGVVLFIVTFTACYVPARQSTKIDAILALRAE